MFLTNLPVSVLLRRILFVEGIVIFLSGDLLLLKVFSLICGFDSCIVQEKKKLRRKALRFCRCCLLILYTNFLLSFLSALLCRLLVRELLQCHNLDLTIQGQGNRQFFLLPDSQRLTGPRLILRERAVLSLFLFLTEYLQSNKAVYRSR